MHTQKSICGGPLLTKLYDHPQRRHWHRAPPGDRDLLRLRALGRAPRDSLPLPQQTHAFFDTPIQRHQRGAHRMYDSELRLLLTEIIRSPLGRSVDRQQENIPK